MKRLALILVFLPLLHQHLQAQGFIDILILTTPGGAAVGKGKTGVADATGAFAGHLNPAALAFLSNNEIVYHRAAWVPDWSGDLNYNFLAGRYHIEGFGTIGGHITYFDWGTQTARAENNNNLGEFSSYMLAVAVSYSAQISALSSLGANTKIIRQTLGYLTDGSHISTSFAFDLGYYRQQLFFSQLDFGLSLSNLGPEDDFKSPAPAIMRLGFKWQVVETEKHRLALFYDMSKPLVANHPSIDYDGDRLIGGYDKNGAYDGYSVYGAEGQHEEAHVDPWYLGIITSWYDDWLLGGDIDINGNNIIDDEEVGNKEMGSFRAEYETISHYVGIEYWLFDHLALRYGYMDEKRLGTKGRTFGIGLKYGGFRADIAYDPSLTTPRHISVNYAF